MYEGYSKQALPSKRYRELLGSAICVFNSNNAFIIENILRFDKNHEYNWNDLLDLTSGALSSPIKKTITRKSNTKIANQFEKIFLMRNRIEHSFQITDKDGEQKLATKEKGNGIQYIITEEFILKFIKMNEELAMALHDLKIYQSS